MTASKVAIVTGASRGIGAAAAVALAETGACLVLVSRNAALLEAVAEKCTLAGSPQVICCPCDLSLASEPTRVAALALDRFGRIDILVNVAGDTRRGHFLSLSDEDHISGFALKYHATVRLCRACWPSLEDARGCIVNISGIGALTPEPEFTIGGPVNAALLNFSKALSRVAPDKVRVNSLCPGHIVTERLQRRIDVVAKEEGLSDDAARERLRQRLDISHFGKPEDIAWAVRYLCSPEARYVNGTNLIVDGGATPGL